MPHGCAPRGNNSDGNTAMQSPTLPRGNHRTTTAAA
eukprot:CAMPEP_0174856188 /NCGR_PEP_ID=MMETSP1114-20130205/35291_1 /TAXON_ID=312471 /ORGANISM="Neobodo designis, Strain CCAP 1951/1" /LENGTH=35 /DNA_ID= /DNA_START= /DNA_END= /DNA_ORIENTATION=